MRLTLAVIFFLSGASALVFESLWFRLAGLSLGNSVWSASLVLAAFMGGLALGNGLVAKLHGRILHPVRLYAALEFTIGIGGISVVLLLPHLPGLLGPVLGSLADAPLLLNTVRLTIAFTILLMPAIAMGATLPVLAKALSCQDSNFGANIGWLYGWNTLGAMLGALGTELFLVPAYGIVNSGVFALALNLMAALIALRYSQVNETAPASAPTPKYVPRSTDSPTRRYIAVAFLSGALMLALEVVWFRFLLLTLDGTSLIFAVMLAVVLAGIAIGGLVAAFLFRRDERAYRWLKHVSAASGALVVLTYWGYDLFGVYRELKDTTTAEFIGYATFLMFPVAALSGAAFTLVNRAIKDHFDSSARTAGIATLCNTIGAMLGSLAGGFVLLPVLGIESSLFVLAAGYCLAAFVVPAAKPAAKFTVLSGRGALAAAITCLAIFPFGLMRDTYFATQYASLQDHTLVTAREGLAETIRYYRRDYFGEPRFYRLVTNGYSMSATTTAAKRYMKLYVYLPLALKADARNALLISYGVGSTAKALVDSPDLEAIDVVDISEDILELSTVVYPGEDNPLRDERVRVVVEDGRFFLNTTTNSYDLITSEPPPPKMAGVVNLYSEEYFSLIRTRLNPGGFVTYWLPVVQLDPLDTLAIIRAFCNAFDDCSLWSGAGLEWMLLGSNGADAKPGLTEFSAQWRVPGVRRELVALGLESPAQLGSLFMADTGLLAGVSADIAPVTDNYPSRISPGLIFNEGYVELYDFLMDESNRNERFRTSDYISQLLPAEIRDEAAHLFKYERMIKNHFTGGSYRRESEPYYWAAVDDVLTNTTLTTLPLWLLGSDQEIQDIVARLVEQHGFRNEYALPLAQKFASERKYETALMYARSHVENSDEVTDWTARFYLYLLGRNGMAEQARPIVANLESLGREGTEKFVDWYVARFNLTGESNLEPPSARGQEVTQAAE